MATSSSTVRNGPKTPSAAMMSEEAPFPMGTVGRHAVTYGVGILLGRIVAVIMLPVYTRYLTPADYGLLQLVVMTMEVVSIVAGSRVAQGIFRFYHKAATDDERTEVISTALLVLAGSYLVACLATMAAAVPIAAFVFETPEHAMLIRIAGAALAFESLIIVPLAYLRLRDRATTFVLVNAVKLALQVAMNVTFVVFYQMGAEGVLLGNLVAYAIVGTALAVNLARRVGLRVSGRSVRDLLRFGLPLVVTQVATFFTTYGDRYFLVVDGGTADVGLYGLGYQFGFLLVLVGLTPFLTVWEPTRFKIAERPDRDRVYAQAFVYCNLALITTAVLIVLFVEDLLRIVADPAFHAAAQVVPVIIVAFIFHSWTQFQNLGILIRERTELITAANWVAVGVALVGYLTLIPPLLGLGAALATLLTFAVRWLLVYWWSQRVWPVRYEWKPVRRLVALATVAAGLGWIMPTPSLAVSVSGHLFLVMAYMAVVWRWDILTPADRATAIRLARRALEVGRRR